MSAPAILFVASAPDTARGPATSDADANAFAEALTRADVGATPPARPAHPSTSITRDNAIRGEEVAVRPEAANTDEAVMADPVQPLATPPPVPRSNEGEAASSEPATGAQTLVIADAGTDALVSATSDALPPVAAPQPVEPAVTPALTGADATKAAETPAQPTPLAALDAEDAAAQATTTASKAATDLALLNAFSDSTPAANGLVPQPAAPRGIIERALRAGSQIEATAADDAAIDADGSQAQASGDKLAPVQDPVTAMAQRPASETQQQAIDVVPMTAAAGGEHAETGAQTASAATAADASAVTAQDLTLSTLARATIETTAQLSAQIVRKLEGRYTRFELALTPEGLGRVDVSLDIDSDGRLAARLAFDNPAAAIDLRGRADELRRQLEDAGFRIASDGLDFAERDTSSGGGFDRGRNQQGNRAFAGASRLATMADETVERASPWIKLNLTPRGVDMKV